MSNKTDLDSQDVGSKILYVTYDQAKKLKELGFSKMVRCYFCDGVFKTSEFICDYNADTNIDKKELISAPRISTAIGFIYKTYGIYNYVEYRLGLCVFILYKNGKDVLISHIPMENTYPPSFPDYINTETQILSAIIQYVEDHNVKKRESENHSIITSLINLFK